MTLLLDINIILFAYSRILVKTQEMRKIVE